MVDFERVQAGPKWQTAYASQGGRDCEHLQNLCLLGNFIGMNANKHYGNHFFGLRCPSSTEIVFSIFKKFGKIRDE